MFEVRSTFIVESGSYNVLCMGSREGIYGVGSHKPVDDNRDRVGQWWYFANIDEGGKGLGSLNFTI